MPLYNGAITWLCQALGLKTVLPEGQTIGDLKVEPAGIALTACKLEQH